MGGGGAEVGVQARVQAETNSGRVSDARDKVFRSRKAKPHSPGSKISVAKRGDRRGHWRPRIGLLLPSLSRNKEEREVKTHNRPEETESEISHSQIPDGVDTVGMGEFGARKFHFFAGPNRCLLSRPDSPQLQKIPEVSVRREGLSVHGPSLRLVHKSVDIHKDSVGGEKHCSSSPDLTDGLSGRLASSGFVSPTRVVTGADDARPVSVSRSTCQYGEVGPGPIASLQIHRGQVRPDTVHGLSGRGQCSEGCQHCPCFHKQSESDCQKMAVSPGHTGITRQVYIIREVPCSTTSVALGGQLGPNLGVSVQTSSSSSLHQGTAKMVVAATQTEFGGSASPSEIRPSSVLGRLNIRLGGSSQSDVIPGSVVSRGDESPHKRPGNEGGEKGSQGSCSPSFLKHLGGHGQQDRGRLHQQGGRDQVLVSHEGDNQSLSYDNGQQLVDQSQVHSREAKCDSRPAISQRSNSSHGVVASPSGCKRPLCSTGGTPDRPIRNEIQQQVRTVCIPRSRSSSLGDRCLVSRPGGSQRLCVSATSGHPQTATEVSAHKEVQVDSNSSLLAKASLVSFPKPVNHSRANTTSSETKSAEATAIKHISQPASDAEPTRMASREVDLQSRGFEASVIDRVVKPHALSTESVYDGKWKRWVHWCTKFEIEVHKPSVANIADFLSYLFSEQKVEYSTIAGYRSMLSGALSHTGLDIGHDKDLSDLMLSFRHARPPRSKIFPDWDLSLVLWSLTEPPFEPMFDEAKVNMKFLTWKTVFLTLLAAGARRGELHAVPFKNVSYDKEFSHLTLRPSESFIAKTQVKTGSRLRAFRIPSLLECLDKDLVYDRKLCPCRSMKHYLKRTESVRKSDPSKSLLFVSFDPRKKGDIMKNTISGWVSQLIRHCYSQPGAKAIQLTGARTHEVRAYAATLVSRGTSSIDDILAAGNWKAHTTFTHHYLRDITRQEGNMLRMGPIVAGQKIVIHTSDP